MNDTWFTSDTHFYHANVIKYCNRPYSSVEEMNEAIILEWNSKVKPDDIIYHLGDFSFAKDISKTMEIVDRLNGQIFLIRGNHDYGQFVKKFITHPRVIDVRDLYKLKIKDPDSPSGTQEIVLCHYAMEVWNHSHYGAWHLFGHSHGTLPDNLDKMRLDVGMDNHGMKILSYEDVKVAMFQRSIGSVDHHDPKNPRFANGPNY
jgi:calcineurin-like phosphoesterase family protein